MENPKISIIVAVAGQNRAIGKHGKLPWYIPDELKRFKQITMGHPIIMGRKTHESIGKALPGRDNIVITRDENYQAEGCIVVHSLDEAINVAKEKDSQEIFIIGGGEIYKQAMPLVDKLYLTTVQEEIEDADVFFPDFSDFTKREQVGEGETEGIKYQFWEMEKE